jgi:hypothetical protein
MASMVASFTDTSEIDIVPLNECSTPTFNVSPVADAAVVAAAVGVASVAAVVAASVAAAVGVAAASVAGAWVAGGAVVGVAAGAAQAASNAPPVKAVNFNTSRREILFNPFDIKLLLNYALKQPLSIHNTIDALSIVG